jgi:excisionase family DNA binding protein
VTDLRATFTPEFVDAIERLVDERVELRLREPGPGVSRNDSPWLSISEAAAYMRVSERKLQRVIASGGLRSTTLGRRRLLHRDDLDAFIESDGGGGIAPTTPPRRRRG